MRFRPAQGFFEGFLDAVVSSRGGWTVAAPVWLLAGLLISLLLFGQYLFGAGAAEPDGGREPYPVPAVIQAEQDYLARTPGMTTGLPANAVRPWAFLAERGMSAIADDAVRARLEGLRLRLEPLADQFAQGQRVDQAAAGSIRDAMLASNEEAGRNRGPVLYHLGVAQLFAGNLQDARDTLTEAVELAGEAWGGAENDLERRRLTGLLASTGYALGHTLLRLEEPQEAAEAFQQALIAFDRGRESMPRADQRERYYVFIAEHQSDLTRAEIATDLIVARLAAASAVRGRDREARHQDIRTLLETFAAEGDAPRRNPRLAVNLQIAAVAVGARARTRAFSPILDGATLTGPLQAASDAAEAFGGGETGRRPPWSQLARWRTKLQAGDLSALSAPLPRADVTGPVGETYRAWRADVGRDIGWDLLLNGRNGSDELGRALIRANAAAFPREIGLLAGTLLGPVASGILAVLILALALWGNWMFWRFRDAYRWTLRPLHHEDRTGAPPR